MNDLERDLRDLLETKARDGGVAPPPAPKLFKRARRRQVSTVLTAILGTTAVVVGSIAGLRTLTATDVPDTLPAEPPVLPDAPAGFRSVALPFASIAYPEGWSVLAFRNQDEVLQITNFDPEFTTPCFTSDAQPLPPLGVILRIERVPGTADQSLPTWPVVLYEPDSAASDCLGAQEEDFGEPEAYRVTWQSGSSTFVARTVVGPLTPNDARRMLFDSFSSLVTVDGDLPQTEEPLGDSNLILDSTMTPVGPVALYAYVDEFEGGSAWIGIAGPAGTGLNGAGQVGREVPSFDENVTMNLDSWGGVVWGTVAAIVERAELRTVEGGTFPATLLPLPPLPLNFSVEGHQIVWGVIDVATADRVTTLLHDEQGNVLNTYYPTGPRVVIATGTDPEGGAWELYLEPTDQGTGLGFSFTIGGGGGGCCLTSLAGDFRLDGSGSGSGEPSHITALASEIVVRVVFETANGDRIEGQVFPVPDESLGIPKVALVLVPEDVALEGHLVAYDADGNELGRELVTTDFSEPAGPTPEIDAVWQSLRAARDAAARYLERHGTFDTITLDALIEIAPPGSVTFATRSEPETVSVFVIDEFHLVVSSSAITGEAYCIAIEADGPEGGFGYRYGAVFAESYDECRGGWPELGV
jgi:hypothetical protein